MIYLAIGIGVIAVLAGLRVVWRYTIAVVHGSSMEPTLWAGDRLLVRRCALAKLRRGDIVVIREPHLPARAAERLAWLPVSPGLSRFLVKRAVAVPGDPLPPAMRAPDEVVPQGAIVILGDNPFESRDSRLYGYIHEEHVVGRAVRRLGE